MFNKGKNTIDNFYIFLDIDGVLNKSDDWNRPFTFNKKCLSSFDALLKVLYEKYSKCYIILISSWKDSLNDKQMFKPLEEVLIKYNIFLFKKTKDFNGKFRQDEIIDYLHKHSEIKDYITLDDDEQGYYDLEDCNVYLVNYKTGLTDKDIKAIIKQVKKGKYKR